MSLTVFAYAWLAAITLSGIAGQWYGDGWQDLWRYLAAGIILALGMEGVLARHSKYSIAREAPAIGHLGEPVGYSLVVTNQEADQLRIETQQVFPDGMAGESTVCRQTVGPRASRAHPFAVVPYELGHLEWQPIYTRALGRFGMAWWTRKLEVNGTIQVVPGRLQNRDRTIGVQAQGEHVQRAAGAGKELLWLRDYRPGDPLRAIDWKATARRSRHIVRVLTDEQHVELMLLLDAGKTSGLYVGPLTRLNQCANVAAKLAEQALANGDQVGLIVFAEKPLHVIQPVKGPGGLVQIRRVLETLRPAPREANPLPATLLARTLLRRRSLVVIFTETDDTDAAGQLIQAVRLLSSKHLPLIASITNPDIVALQHQKAKDWLDPYQAFAASETLQASRLNVLRLQRMGAYVAMADPSHLDGSVLQHYHMLRTQKRI